MEQKPLDVGNAENLRDRLGLWSVCTV
jgi:hypothetical protein